MNIVVIGGTGHIGRFLTPMLVDEGHSVTVLSRGETPAPDGEQWAAVKMVLADVGGPAALSSLVREGPDVVIDIPGSARASFDSVRGIASHVIAIGSLWMYGDPVVVPTPEVRQSPCPFEGYARRYAEILAMAEQSSLGGTAFTAIMPPNICGPGKIPLDCLGGRDSKLHRDHAAGREVVLPSGPEALVGPCDAEDIARCVALAVGNRAAAAGHVFNVGAAYALTWTQFVRAFGDIHGISIPIRLVTWPDYIEQVSPGIGYWWHMKAHMCPDIGKARRLLGYEPTHTPEATMARAIDWMRTEGLI